MADDTLTLVLNGRVTLAQFATATQSLYKLVDALSCEIDRKAKVEWDIVGLEVSSAITTVKGEAQSPETIAAVVHAFEIVGESLRQYSPVPYSARVARPAANIVKLLNGRISSIRFETRAKDITVVSEGLRGKIGASTFAHGMVEGRVQTLSSRAGLRFTLYDKIYDSAVSCYVQQDQESQMRDIWGHRAAVEGWVTRDKDTGKPVSVRRITSIQVLPEVDQGHYRNARGVSPITNGQPSAEQVIRTIRNAWSA